MHKSRKLRKLQVEKLKAVKTRKPVTLRDIQRLKQAGRPLPYVQYMDGTVWDEMTLPKLSRLIAAYGPGYDLRHFQFLERDERGARRVTEKIVNAIAELAERKETQPERKKGTDEVALQSGTPSADSQLHGGDGNSGECDHAAQSDAAERRENGERTAENTSPGEDRPEGSESAAKPRPETPGSERESRSSGEGSESAEEQAKAEAEADSATSREAQRDSSDVTESEPQEREPAGQSERPSAEKLTGGEASTPEPEGLTSTPDDAGELADADTNQPEEQDGGSPESQASESADGTPQASRSARFSHGGDFLPENLPRRMDRNLLIQARKALLRFIEQENTGLEASPRLAGRKLITELSTRRYSVSRCRRQELARKRVLLAVDVSGSCSATCGEAYYAAQALAAVDPRLVLLIHSNGCPVTFVVDGKSMDVPATKPHEGAAWVVEQLLKLNISAGVLMGDWDALVMHEALAEAGAKLVWLDSFAKNAGMPKRTELKIGEVSLALKKQAAYWTRCGTAQDFIQVLKEKN